MGLDLLHPGAVVMGNHFKALGAQVFQCFPVGLKGHPLRKLDIEYQNIQPAGGGDLRVQLPQRSSGGVAGIGKQSFSPALPLLIQGMKHLFGHKYLSPDNQSGRSVGNFQWDGPDGPQIFRHILPNPAVSPGSSPDKQAVFILQRHRQPVHLGLHHIRRAVHHALNPLPKIP